MADDFLTKKHCDRCGGSLKWGRIMSMFNEDCICMDCMQKEKEHQDYARARIAEQEAVKSGNYNFKGIGF